MTGREASEVSDLSLRYVGILLAACRRESAAISSHGNLGCQPSQTIPEESRERVGILAQGLY